MRRREGGLCCEEEGGTPSWSHWSIIPSILLTAKAFIAQQASPDPWGGEGARSGPTSRWRPEAPLPSLWGRLQQLPQVLLPELTLPLRARCHVASGQL